MKALQMLDLIASDSAYWGRNIELTPFCDQTLNLLVPVGQRSYLEKFVRDMRVVRCSWKPKEGIYISIWRLKQLVQSSTIDLWGN